MVGIFSRFSGRHRRTQSSCETLPPKTEVGGSMHVTTVHGTEIAVGLKPVEHPTEPLNRDQPIKCPLPEPSILNDGRIWKERMSSANARPRGDLPVVKEKSQLDSEACGTTHRTVPAKGYMLSSFSAPEHNLINLVEEYNAAEGHSTGFGTLPNERTYVSWFSEMPLTNRKGQTNDVRSNLLFEKRHLLIDFWERPDEAPKKMTRLDMIEYLASSFSLVHYQVSTECLSAAAHDTHYYY